MGVPKFFRWISERYPKINQPIHCPPNVATRQAYFPHENVVDEENDNNETERKKAGKDRQDLKIFTQKSTLLPEFDRLYFDMNGDSTATSDPDTNIEEEGAEDVDTLKAGQDGAVSITEEEVFRNVCYYVDRLVTDIVQPKELVYMAIDGVAPRAKMNQQRSRRYRSGKEKEIESTFYGSRLQQEREERERLEELANVDVDDASEIVTHDHSTTDFGILPTSSGKFDTSSTDDASDMFYDSTFDQDYESFIESIKGDSSDEDEPTDVFHSNSITPGTAFFERCTLHLEEFIRHKLQYDPRWSHLTIIFSGPNVPGEGEHKIMDFMRSQKQRKDYNVNTRHCLFGQDGDLIMLGLATHEPNFCLLREEVVFSMTRKQAEEERLRAQIELDGEKNDKSMTATSIHGYIHNSSFELLHMSVLREYLAYEFETKDVVKSGTYDLERTIDDFVFLTFFVGNDFLPNMPAIEISEEAFDLLFYTYKRLRHGWIKQGKPNYLTFEGEIASGDRLEQFLSELGQHEDPFYDNRKRNEPNMNKRMRKMDMMAGREPSIPPDDVLQAKEKWDRTNFKEMLESIDGHTNVSVEGFTPVTSSENLFSQLADSKDPSSFKPEENEDIDAGFFSRMIKSVQNSISTRSNPHHTKGDIQNELLSYDEHASDLKGRYYYDKFKFSPLDAEEHLNLRKAYIKGLVWNLQYYYRGCACWEWYYPYHYGPMLSDLVDINNMLEDISFDETSNTPVTPFEQLICVMPPSSSYLLPKPFQYLMRSPHSPLKSFYPNSFTVDMNGKRWPWEAVVLLPFIDSKLLIETCRSLISDELLSEAERRRNELGAAQVYNCEKESSAESTGVVIVRDIAQTEWKHHQKTKFRSWISPECIYPLPGFSTLKEAPVRGLRRRRLGIDVFGLRSRYRSAILEGDRKLPAIPSTESLAERFIGTTLYFRYPHFQEGFVTAVSDAETTIRGKDGPRKWNETEALAWELRNEQSRKQYESGEGFTGSGGWRIPESPVTICLRPLQQINEMADGSKVKVYAKTEIEVPLVATLWSPSLPDPRLNIPARLEKNPYRFGLKQASILLRKPKDNGAIPTESKDVKNNKGNLHTQPKAYGGGFNILPSAPMKRDNIALNSGRRTTRNFTTLTTSKSTKAPYIQTHLHKCNNGGFRMRCFTSVTTAFAVLMASAIGIEGRSNFAHACKSSHNEPYGVLFRTRGGDESRITSLFDDQDNDHSQTKPLEFAHGTTTISFTYEGGIVAAVDSRASIGNFVGSKTVQKVLPISDRLLGTMAGGAADCSFWIRKIQAYAKHFQSTKGSELTVARASRLLSDYLYANRGAGLSVGTMVMGYDDNHGASIYYVDNTGNRLGGDLFAVGSGSTFALGVLDRERRENMSEKDAISLCIKAIRHATFRDAYSGGYIAVYVINSSGWKKVFSEDLALSFENTHAE